MAERIPQSVAYLVVFRAFLASDGKTVATGKTIAITISKNGGAFGNPNAGATNATEISSGFYKFTLDTTDTGTLGPLAWRGAEGTINDAGDVLTVAVAVASQSSVDDLPTNAELTTALGTADDAMLTAIGDLPTNAELATALGTADDAVLAAVAALNNLSAAQVRTELATELARIDVAVSTRASQTSADDLPTNAELATALATADDAVLAAITALNNLSAAQVRTELTTELGRIDAAVSTRATPAQILTTALTEAYAADGASPTLSQLLFLLLAVLTEASVVTTTMTAKKLDGSTPAATFTLDDATNPTSITRAS